MQHNNIEKIDGLTTLTKLQVLSLGCNHLTDVAYTAEYLRPMKSIQAVNLQDNPMCDNVDVYPGRVLATVPQLKYLDWVKITEEARTEGRIQFVREIEKLEIVEAELKQKQEADAAQAAITEALVADGVPEMAGGAWYARLFPTLPEAATLCTVPGFSETLETLQQHFDASAAPIREAGRVFTETRQQIERDVEAALHEGRATRQQDESERLINGWRAEKEAVLTEIEEEQNSTTAGIKVLPSRCMP